MSIWTVIGILAPLITFAALVAALGFPRRGRP